MNKCAVVLLNFLIFSKIFSNSFAYPKVNIPKTMNYTAEYISSLIGLQNQQDTSRNHDVALIRLEKMAKSGKCDDIIDKL